MKRFHCVAALLLLASVGMAQPFAAITVGVGPHTTVQSAINDIAPGGVISVPPGTYVETLLVDPAGTYGTVIPTSGATAFSIVGTGPGVIIQAEAWATRSTFFTSRSMMTASGKQADGNLWIIGANGMGAGITLENLTFDGNDDMGTGATSTAGAAFVDSVGIVTDCTFHGVRQNATSGAQNGLGLYGEGALTDLTVENCTFYDIQKGHAVVRHGKADYDGCTFIGRGRDPNIAQNAIQYSSGAYGTVQNCTIDGYWWTGPTWTSSGILVFEPAGPVVVTGNTFRDAQLGVYVYSNGLDIDVQILNNDFTHASPPLNGFNGVYVSPGGMGAMYTIQGNSFNHHAQEGVYVESSGGTITGNYFNGNGGVSQAYDDNDGTSGGAANNWDGNTWSDLATNGGFPSSYDIPGVATASDNDPSGGCPEFTVENVSVPAGPAGVTLVDANGDGHLDAVVASAGTGSLDVLLNDGDGNFGASTPVAGFAAAGALGKAVTADLHMGLASDVAVLRTSPAAVALVENLGTHLSWDRDIALSGAGPAGIAAGNFDGTGTADLVVALEGDALGAGGGLQVILNGGAPASLTAPVGGFQQVRDVVVCDLDGDGDMDIVAVMAGSLFAPTTNNVLFYEGDGSGSFGYVGALPTTNEPQGLSCGDLNGDGLTDLAVSEGSLLATGGVSLLLNGGLTPGAWNLGAFGGAGTFEGGLVPTALICLDLQDDSIPGFQSRMDVVALNFGSSNLTVFRNFDGADFGTRENCGAGINPSAVVAGELNGDDTPDFLITNQSSDTLSVHLGTPRALAQTFGAGCAGTGGNVPEISASVLPAFGANFAIELSNARPHAPALLGLSLGQETRPVGGGCDLYLADDIVLFNFFTSASGEAALHFTIPADMAPFTGLDVYAQWAVFDPNGSYNNMLAFSEALRLKFGN